MAANKRGLKVANSPGPILTDNDYSVYNTHGGHTTYASYRENDIKFILNHANCPVLFSPNDNYIRLFVDGKWVAVNGWSKEEYERLVMKGEMK